MGKTRRQFSEDFKRDAVNLLLSSGKSISTISAELGIGQSNLARWKDLLMGKEEKEISETPAEKIRRLEAANQRLEKENATLKQEREILKKSLGIVSKQ
jgi:transposase